MKISYPLALNIRDQYKELGKKFNNLNEFTWKELAQITKLEVTNADSLDDLIKLPSLKKLVIKSENYNHFDSNIDLKNNTLINRIQDFSVIEKLTNLEELEIINDINIKKLDLTKLTKLKKLRLINNPGLIAVKNLEKLRNLEEVVIYGTNIKNYINFKEYILNTIYAKKNILDINMYHTLMDGSEKNSKFFSDLYKLKYNKVLYAEKTGFAEFALLTPEQVNELYQMCYKFIKNKKLYRLDSYEQIKEIYKFVTTNITFDNEGILKRDLQYLSMNLPYRKIPLHLKNKFSMIHSSYNAGILKKSNCEGYVNLMNFMLRMLNIETASVYAAGKKSKLVAAYNHALTSVKLDGNWYYCDPSLEKPGEFKYFMKTFDEISKTHILNPLELLKYKEVSINVARRGRN